MLLALLMLLSMLSFIGCDGENEPDEGQGGEDGEDGEQSGDGGEDDENDGDGDEGEQDGEPVTYTVTVTDIDGAPVAGVRVQICNDTTCHGLPAVTNAEGVAILNNIPLDSKNKAQISSVPSGYILPSDGTDEGGNNIPVKYEIRDKAVTIIIGKEPDGSADNPFFISELSTAITVPAGASHYYMGKNMSAYRVSIDNFAEGAITYGADEYLPDSDGKIELELPVSTEQGVSYSTFVITNNGESDATVTLVCTPPRGSMANPIAVEALGELTAVITAKVPMVYYVWTAETAGTFTVTTENQNAGINLNGSVYQSTGDSEPIVATAEVTAGQEVHFNIGVIGNDPAEIVFTVSFVPESA